MIETFSERVQVLMKENNLSVNELASRWEISSRRVVRLLDNVTSPRSIVIIKLSQLFGVSVDYLLGLSESRKSEKRRR